MADAPVTIDQAAADQAPADDVIGEAPAVDEVVDDVVPAEAKPKRAAKSAPELRMLKKKPFEEWRAASALSYSAETLSTLDRLLQECDWAALGPFTAPSLYLETYQLNMTFVTEQMRARGIDGSWLRARIANNLAFLAWNVMHNVGTIFAQVGRVRIMPEHVEQSWHNINTSFLGQFTYVGLDHPPAEPRKRKEPDTTKDTEAEQAQAEQTEAVEAVLAQAVPAPVQKKPKTKQRAKQQQSPPQDVQGEDQPKPPQPPKQKQKRAPRKKATAKLQAITVSVEPEPAAEDNDCDRNDDEYEMPAEDASH